jgi:hypothetical protein
MTDTADLDMVGDFGPPACGGVSLETVALGLRLCFQTGAFLPLRVRGSNRPPWTPNPTLTGDGNACSEAGGLIATEQCCGATDSSKPIKTSSE